MIQKLIVNHCTIGDIPMASAFTEIVTSQLSDTVSKSTALSDSTAVSITISSRLRSSCRQKLPVVRYDDNTNKGKMLSRNQNSRKSYPALKETKQTTKKKMIEKVSQF